MLADMAPPLSTMLYPFLEVLIITALSWMLIGWMDRPENMIDPQLRNIMVLIWLLLVLWRFIVPLIRTRRQRFMVTNKRVVVKQGRATESIPLAQISGARRYRGGINIGVYGYAQPVYFPEVGRVKRVEELIRRQLP